MTTDPQELIPFRASREQQDLKHYMGLLVPAINNLFKGPDNEEAPLAFDDMSDADLTLFVTAMAYSINGWMRMYGMTEPGEETLGTLFKLIRLLFQYESLQRQGEAIHDHGQAAMKAVEEIRSEEQPPTFEDVLAKWDSAGSMAFEQWMTETRARYGLTKES